MYSRIAPTIYPIFLLLIMIGCKDTKKTSTDTTSNQEESTNTINSAFLKEHFPILDSVSRSEEDLHQNLNKYAYNLMNASNTVKSDEDLEKLFGMRDNKILSSLHKDVLDPIALDNGVFYHSPAGSKLDKELRSLGMQAIYAEGMYLNLGPAEMLKKEMNTYASEVFKLYMEFQSAKTTSMMGEYPYLNLEGERKMVAIGEKIRSKYSEHDFAKAIEADFWNALMPFTDIHMVKSEFDRTYIAYELATDFYPYATNVDSLRRFLTNHPDSKYTPLINNVLSNISEMESVKGKWKDLYLVVLSWEDVGKKTYKDEDGNEVETTTCEEAKIRNDFIEKGIDISTVLKLKKKKSNVDECALGYRFYADKGKAETALQALKSKTSDVVGIVGLHFDPVQRIWNVK